MNREPGRQQPHLNSYEKILYPTTDFIALISGVAITSIMLLTAADVIARFIFKASILGAFELVEFFMAVAIPFALCYCEKFREHVSVDLFIQFFPPKARQWLDLITSISALVVYVLVAITCWINVLDVKEGYLLSSVLMIKVWPWTIPSAIGFTLLFLLSINYIAKIVITIIKGEGETV